MTTLAVCVVAATGVLVFRQVDTAPRVRRLDVPPAPEPRVRVFGEPGRSSRHGPTPRPDTGLPLLDDDPEVMPALDALRARGAWCGPPADELAWDERLADAAHAQAQWLARSGVRAHVTPRSPVGRTATIRARRFGYPGAAGEVLAWGRASGADAVDWWESSETHCPVLVDASWRAVGAAWHDDVWVVKLGDR